MRLPLRMTIIFFLVSSVLLLALSTFFYSQLNRSFSAQFEQLLAQASTVSEMRMNFLGDDLANEMETISSTLFSENETTLARMLSEPPQFDTEVISFAGKLQSRSRLDSLVILSPEGIILSSSPGPAFYGKFDLHRDFPLETPSILFDQAARLEYKLKVSFGNRFLYLRGGYDLRKNLAMSVFPGAQIRYGEGEPGAFQPEEPPNKAQYLSRAMPLHDYRNRPVGQLLTSVSKEPFLEERKSLIWKSIWLVAGTLAFSLLTGYLLSVWISRPISRLTEAAGQMASGDLETEISEEGSEEVTRLIEAFNSMAHQIKEHQQKLMQAERIAAWQEIARHLAHEIKNPLTPIRTSIANLRFSMEKAPEKFPEIFLEASEAMIEEVEKLRHLADEFARFARLPSPVIRPENLNDIAQKSVALYRPSLPAGVLLELQLESLPLCPVDSAQISEVFQNLLQNASDAVGPQGRIRVSTSCLKNMDNEWVTFTVEDNGKGMNESIRKQLFTPYFTTKPKGTGLGLAIVHRIITEHHGRIFVESAPEKGTKFEVHLLAVRENYA